MENSVDIILQQKQTEKGLVNGTHHQEDHVELQEQTNETAKKTDGSASFLRAARAGNLEKVLEFLKTNTDINTCNANGLNALHLASKEGHTHVVSALLERDASVDSATKKGNTALHIASLSGQEDIVRVLVDHGASVNIQSQNGFTPLYMAAQEDHDSVVRFLLAHGANQSLATEEGFTPLAVALQQGHNKVVSVLLENDTRGKVRLPALHIAAKKDDAKAAALLLLTDHNPDVTSKSGFTPLHIASHYGNQNIAALLIQRGADVNYVAKHQINPLHVASKWGKGNMVALLLERGANIEAKTRDGLTPLHCAARSGHETVVDMLLEKEAPITSRTKNGLAPLHMASQGDHVDAARILLYHKAPVDDVTVDFLTALHVAAHCGHVRVAKLLLDRKADPNARALNGFTPLHIACKKNRIKVVELLLKHGASIEATTESGLTPLHVASFMGCMNIVIYLIQHGCSVDVPTVRGETPLHLAARANQTDIIRILLRNGAQVDARARELQSALHIASRLGNADNALLLMQHGATVDAATKDHYTPLHIACKEGQEEVCAVLLEHGASHSEVTKKGFTPLHLASKYGQLKVVKLLLQKDAPVDAQGKNNVTPLHVAAHYDHQNVALLLLDKGASPHATAKNGYTPLHIAARKNQMDIAATLIEYGARPDAESRAGFTPLHLSSQEGHMEMTSLLIEHKTDVGAHARNGLTPLHLAAQEDKVGVAAILVKNGAKIDPETKAGYTPLHVACHFGQMNMVRFLLQHGANVDVATQLGYTPLHQASQQGHTQIINILLENKAEPNMETKDGKTALSIAHRLGYISVVETLKIVTETKITTNTTTVTEEKYKVVVPETMHETFLSESEDEGGDDTMLGDQSYRFLTVDEMKSLGDDSMPIDDRMDISFQSNLTAPLHPTADLSLQHVKDRYSYPLDNVDISRAPVLAGVESLNTTLNTSMALEEPRVINTEVVLTHQLESSVPDQETTLPTVTANSRLTPEVGIFQESMTPPPDPINWWDQFLVSFMVDARGGAMRGCRHSGVRVIIPPRKAGMPTRITCRYLKKDKLVHAPPLMEGEALSSRILEMGPSGAKFLGPVIIEVPHFASLRGKEREIVILRSDNGETWKEHTLEATEEAVQDVLNESFDGEELKQLEELNTSRITRILTTDFPQYFAIVTRIRQEVHAIGPDGGMVSSTVVPQVQAVFPHGALTKKIKVGLQAQPISPELVAKLLGNRVAVSPIVTVEPRRRKFHKPITLTIPVPQAASKGMINQYSGETPTLRLLCSITGGTSRAVWEDVTGSTPLTLVNDCVSFTTTVSARFWLMDCTNIPEATKMATELYREAIHVPFMSKFAVFSKRHQVEEARVRVFCMTDDKEDKTLETQEQFIEVAKSRDVEVLEGKSQYLEFGGNLVPVTKSGEQLAFNFYAFRENRLPFTVRVKDINAEPVGRVAFMRQPKVGRGDPPQNPICNLNLSLPENVQPELAPSEPDLLSLERKYAFLSISKADTIHKADLRLSDIANMLSGDWIALAEELEVKESDINIIRSQYPENPAQQAIVMLRLWMQTAENKATGNILEKSLRNINRNDIVDKCIFNVELVTDDLEKAVAKTQLEPSSFDAPKDDLGPSKDITVIRDESIDVSYDEKDIMKDAESAEEEESRKTQPDIRKEMDVSPTYEREEKKYAGEEKSYSIEEKTTHEEFSNKFDEELSVETKQQKETVFPDEGKHIKEESKLKHTDKLSKEDTLSHDEKFTIETESKKGERTEVTTEKIDDLLQLLEEKSHEEQSEKTVTEDLPGYTATTSENAYEKSDFKSSQETRHSQERTFVEVNKRPSDFTDEVSEVITPEKKYSPVDINISSKPMPKDEMLQKLGEELGRLDEKLEEKFKSKMAPGMDEDGLNEVDEDGCVSEERSPRGRVTSQIIIESEGVQEQTPLVEDVNGKLTSQMVAEPSAPHEQTPVVAEWSAQEQTRVAAESAAAQEQFPVVADWLAQEQFPVVADSVAQEQFPVVADSLAHEQFPLVAESSAQQEKTLVVAESSVTQEQIPDVDRHITSQIVAESLTVEEQGQIVAEVDESLALQEQTQLVAEVDGQASSQIVSDSSVVNGQTQIVADVCGHISSPIIAESDVLEPTPTVAPADRHATSLIVESDEIQEQNQIVIKADDPANRQIAESAASPDEIRVHIEDAQIPSQVIVESNAVQDETLEIAEDGGHFGKDGKYDYTEIPDHLREDNQQKDAVGMQHFAETFTEDYQIPSNDFVIENKNFLLSEPNFEKGLHENGTEESLLIIQSEVSDINDGDDKALSDSSSDSGQDTRDSQEFEMLEDSLKHTDTVISNNFAIDNLLEGNVGQAEEPITEDFGQRISEANIYNQDLSFRENIIIEERSHSDTDSQKSDVHDGIQRESEREHFDSSDHQSMDYMQPQLSEDFEPKQLHEFAPGIEDSSILVHSSDEHADDLNDDDSHGEQHIDKKRESLGEMEPQFSEDFQPQATDECLLKDDNVEVCKQDTSEFTPDLLSTDARMVIVEDSKQIGQSEALSHSDSSSSESEDGRDSETGHAMQHTETLDHKIYAETQGMTEETGHFEQNQSEQISHSKILSQSDNSLSSSEDHRESDMDHAMQQTAAVHHKIDVDPLCIIEKGVYDEQNLSKPIQLSDSSMSESEDGRESDKDHAMQHVETLGHEIDAEPQADSSTQLSGLIQTEEIITPQSRGKDLPEVQPVADVSIVSQAINQAVLCGSFSREKRNTNVQPFEYTACSHVLPDNQSEETFSNEPIHNWITFQPVDAKPTSEPVALGEFEAEFKHKHWFHTPILNSGKTNNLETKSSDDLIQESIWSQFFPKFDSFEFMGGSNSGAPVTSPENDPWELLHVSVYDGLRSSTAALSDTESSNDVNRNRLPTIFENVTEIEEEISFDSKLPNYGLSEERDDMSSAEANNLPLYRNSTEPCFVPDFTYKASGSTYSTSLPDSQSLIHTSFNNDVSLPLENVEMHKIKIIKAHEYTDKVPEKTDCPPSYNNFKNMCDFVCREVMAMINSIEIHIKYDWASDIDIAKMMGRLDQLLSLLV